MGGTLSVSALKEVSSESAQEEVLCMIMEPLLAIQPQPARRWFLGLGLPSTT